MYIGIMQGSISRFGEKIGSDGAWAGSCSRRLALSIGGSGGMKGSFFSEASSKLAQVYSLA